MINIEYTCIYAYSCSDTHIVQDMNVIITDIYEAERTDKKCHVHVHVCSFCLCRRNGSVNAAQAVHTIMVDVTLRPPWERKQDKMIPCKDTNLSSRPPEVSVPV